MSSCSFCIALLSSISHLGFGSTKAAVSVTCFFCGDDCTATGAEEDEEDITVLSSMRRRIHIAESFMKLAT